MQFKVNMTVIPKIYFARSKKDLLEVIRSKGLVQARHVSVAYNSLTDLDLYWKSINQGDGNINYGINFEKRRRKTSVLCTGQRIVRRSAEWVAWVYEFPFYVRIKQSNRNFKIVSIDCRTFDSDTLRPDNYYALSNGN